MVYDEKTDKKVRDQYARMPSAAEVIPRRSETGYRQPRRAVQSRTTESDRNDLIGFILLIIAVLVIAGVLLIAAGIIHL